MKKNTLLILALDMISTVSSEISMFKFAPYPNATEAEFPKLGEESNITSWGHCMVKCGGTPYCAAISVNLDLLKCQLRYVVPYNGNGNDDTLVSEVLWLGGDKLGTITHDIVLNII